ncbi:hypothetical protein WJX81_003169 [Elliptochloris bilobata]|uniref:Uncharacterized protein n=1 Tax=Elliptochloris bilobata TaxID=381761 RepID=A0AAW1SD45_9CHLO
MRDLRRQWQADHEASEARRVERVRKAFAAQAEQQRAAAEARAAKRARFAQETAERRAEAAARLARHRAHARQFQATTGYLVAQVRLQQRTDLLEWSRDWIRLEDLDERIDEALASPVPLFPGEWGERIVGNETEEGDFPNDPQSDEDGPELLKEIDPEEWDSDPDAEAPWDEGEMTDGEYTTDEEGATDAEEATDEDYAMDEEEVTDEEEATDEEREFPPRRAPAPVPRRMPGQRIVPPEGS